METLKCQALDFVQSNGPQKWSQIQKMLLVASGQNPNDRQNRGKFSSYLTGFSQFLANGGAYGQPNFNVNYDDPFNRTENSHGLLLRPTKNDRRYLIKLGNLYHLKIA